MRSEQSISIPTVAWMPDNRRRLVTAFLNRPAFDVAAETKAAKCWADIQNTATSRGPVIRQLDGANLTPDQFAVQKAELNAARTQVDADLWPPPGSA